MPVLTDHGVDKRKRFFAVAGADLHEDRRAVVDLKLARLRGPDGLSLVPRQASPAWKPSADARPAVNSKSTKRMARIVSREWLTQWLAEAEFLLY